MLGDLTPDSIDRLERFGRRQRFRHPAQVLVVAFAALIAAGTALLMLPVSRAGEGSAPLIDALFTSTSAVCVAGLATVDPETYWSGFGEAVILTLFQLGGFGIMTLATVIGIVLARRFGLSAALLASAETSSVGLGDLRRVVLAVGKVTIVVELALFLILWPRLALSYDEGWLHGAWTALFHSVSAFNNAGLSTYSDSMVRFMHDWWVIVPVAAASFLGALGFPVLIELRRELRPRKWSLHAKLTILTSVVLVFLGWAFVLVSEWGNPATIGGMNLGEKSITTFFQALMPRTAGFNSLDVGQMYEGTWVGMIILMFIGGGSAGTAGGIKVTTFAVLFLMIWAEVRGERRVNAFGYRIDEKVQRQAVAIALLSVAAVMGGTLVLMALAPLGLGEAWFEVTSAVGTVGMSTGVTADLPDPGKLLIIGLMFLGRLGPVTLVSAITLRQRQSSYTLPEGRPLLG